MRKPEHVTQEWWDRKEDEKAIQRLRGEDYTLAVEAVKRKHSGKPPCDCGTGWYGSRVWCGTCGKVADVRQVQLRRPRVVNGSTVWKMSVCMGCNSRPWGHCPKCGGTGYLEDE